MKRRRFLQLGCAQCAALAGLGWSDAAQAQGTAMDAAQFISGWKSPERFAQPELASEEGGLWAMMNREETKLRRSAFVIRDQGLKDYLTGIVCKLVGEHCPDVRVYPVRTAMFNASMAPNGMMQVWSGLMLRCENEAQLAAVLGHEIGHYLQRHSLQRLQDAKSKSAAAMLMIPFGLIGAIGALATAASVMAYSRDHEREADVIGLHLMKRAGYDPREASKIWSNLLAEARAVPGDKPEQRNALFASHPSSEERSDTLKALAADDAGQTYAVEYFKHTQAFRFDWLDDELKRNRVPESLVLLDRLVSHLPQDGMPLYFRGELRRKRNADGDLAAAQADLQAALLRPEPPAVVHRSLGFLYQQTGQSDASKAAFKQYLDLAPQANDASLIQSYL